MGLIMILCGIKSIFTKKMIKYALVFFVISILPFALEGKLRGFKKFSKSTSNRRSKFRKARKSAIDNYKRERLKEALDDLELALVFSSSSNEKLWTLSYQFNILMKMKAYETAITAMKQGGKLSFLTPAAKNQLLLNQVRALYYLKKNREALDICDKLIISSYRNKREDAYNYQCWIYYRLKQYDKMFNAALKLTRYAARKDHRSLYFRGKYHQVTALLRQNRPDKAMKIFSTEDYFKMKTAEKLNYLIQMGKLYQTQRKNIIALAFLKKASNLPGLDNAQNIKLLMAEINILYSANRLDDALVLCDKLIRSRTADKREYAYNMKCNIFQRLKEYDKMLDNAVKLTLIAAPDSTMYYRGKKHQITALIYKTDYAEAMTVFTRADVAKMNAEVKSDYYNSIGRIHQAQKDYDAAATAYEKSGLASDSSYAVLGNLSAATMYLYSDKNIDALRVYARVFKNSKAQSEQKITAIYKSAEILNKIGRLAESLAMIGKTYKIPYCRKLHWASAKLFAGKILAKQGKLTKARRAYSLAKRRFASVISSPSSSETDVNDALNKWMECDISLIDKSLSKKYAFEEGSFLLKTTLPNNENLKISYLVPVNAQGEPIPSAHNVVFHAPFAGERTPLNNLSRRYFTEHMGFTSFSLNINFDLTTMYDKQKSYVFDESGWHDIVFIAQQKLLAKFKLKPSKLLVVGQSSGGTMAQQLATSHPDQIDAVAMIGGGTFKPIQANSKVAWLALSTWGDWYTHQGNELKKQADSVEVQVLRGETPSILKDKDGKYAHHTAGDLAWRLMQTFIKDVAVLRDKNSGIMPPPDTWPAEAIINNEKVFLPSETFAKLWKKLPHESTALFHNKTDNSSSEYLIVKPQSKRVRNIVLFVHDPLFYASTHLMDNLYFLAKQKSIAIAVKVGDDHFKTLTQIKNVLNTILANKQWKHLRIYVIGSGAGGRLATVAALSNGNPRIKKITTFNSEYNYPFEQLSIDTHRNKSRLSLVMLVDNDAFLPLPKWHNTKSAFIKNNGTKFGKWWFYLLAKAAK
jgi:pimeloyl-ACP methyl ester carboxylesterase/signal recognition particle subunit SEC65